MRTYPAPTNFSGTKFALRYGLNSRKDFWIIGNLIYVPEGLPDDPPIFETPDPPKPSNSARLDTVKTLPELIALLKEVL